MGYRLFRRPRTLQEMKANQDWPVRGSRKPHRLPSFWDDYYRADFENRSWKRYRRTQYKVKP